MAAPDRTPDERPKWIKARNESIARIKAEALREAADEWDEFEVFDAPDGHKSIRQHGKEPDDWLRERADRIEAGEQL